MGCGLYWKGDKAMKKFIGFGVYVAYMVFSVMEFWKIFERGEYLCAGFAICGLGVMGIGASMIIESIIESDKK